ncbi:hypothetical protein [Gaopeijia maritima]|uniref:Uncharacterized protein n=1 Tax=Gaopeijia maritima TaxID=3119007 RepID=A0ABU9EBC0_9BACT
MLRARLIVVLAALVAASGCMGGGLPNPFEASESGDRSIRVEVRNFNFADATLYAYRGAERMRLGVVTGKTDRDYQLAWPATQSMRVEINLLAGERCTTRTQNVSPGDVIYVQIPVELRTDPDCT